MAVGGGSQAGVNTLWARKTLRRLFRERKPRDCPAVYPATATEYQEASFTVVLRGT